MKTRNFEGQLGHASKKTIICLSLMPIKWSGINRKKKSGYFRIFFYFGRLGTVSCQDQRIPHGKAAGWDNLCVESRVSCSCHFSTFLFTFSSFNSLRLLDSLCRAPFLSEWKYSGLFNFNVSHLFSCCLECLCIELPCFFLCATSCQVTRLVLPFGCSIKRVKSVLNTPVCDAPSDSTPESRHHVNHHTARSQSLQRWMWQTWLLPHFHYFFNSFSYLCFFFFLY